MRPQNWVSSRAMTTTALSIRTEMPLATIIVVRWSRSELPSGIPMRLPEIQAALSTM